MHQMFYEREGKVLHEVSPNDFITFINGTNEGRILFDVDVEGVDSIECNVEELVSVGFETLRERAWGGPEVKIHNNYNDFCAEVEGVLESGQLSFVGESLKVSIIYTFRDPEGECFIDIDTATVKD